MARRTLNWKMIGIVANICSYYSLLCGLPLMAFGGVEHSLNGISLLSFPPLASKPFVLLYLLVIFIVY